jgi:nicotinate-nucleotide adenylyltransferase
MEKAAVKVGLYGGTFDPIHFGHINLALEIAEAHALDQVWFFPAHTNPHKQNTPPAASPQQRLRMLQIALEELPQFSILENEIKRSGPSFTIDTLREVVAHSEKSSLFRQFFLILGADSLKDLLQWKSLKEIINIAPPLIGSRTGADIKELSAHWPQEVAQAVQKGLTKIRVLDISATEVRKRIRAGLYYHHLVPSKVIDYIFDNRVY